ncbi:MAG TPA: LLM class flavin-dependent oxidoreductase [Acidisoma sp.]|uniref:LLM class flavin-dependent oxidoreductase n=1 Tax=Acidisoma sp. TaxID=1872115 RepID=UPI002B953D6F|nr:LLM class flavin-dependent oxidoreductase [Acidisoma sp.]HTI00847.1 LLM class flavin-dependent oxidoreductase [Acidisoma sp.]
MPREIRLNAFVMNAPVHQSPGLWRHPRDRATSFNRLDLWLDLARLWERGLFDGVFLADVLGPYDVYGGDARAAVAHAAQLPANDPMLLIPAMAAVTRHLGFGVTVSLSYEHPYPLARRFSTLDHLTGGRVGWNIVTSYLDSAARALGQSRQRAHDDRYALAEDYMEAVYKLWEGSWEEGAVLADRASGRYADPDRVHVVRHESRHLQMEALHLVEPSPQRTPVLYQAGSSPAGLAFAARHAECVFVSGPSAAVIRPRVARLRQALAEAGRTPDSVKVFALATAVIGRSEAEAREKLAEYRSYVDPVGALTLMGGWLGVDFSSYALDQKIRYIDNDAGRAAMENFTRADPGRDWTVREAAEHVAIGGAGPVFVGSGRAVAEEMAAWAESTGVDGFNLAYAVLPESFEDAVSFLIPEWQARGLYKTAYAPGTLREKLSGGSRLLSPPHPAGLARMSQSAF